MHCVGQFDRRLGHNHGTYVVLRHCFGALINNSGANLFKSAIFSLIVRVDIF